MVSIRLNSSAADATQLDDYNIAFDDPRVMDVERVFYDLDKWLSLLENLEQDAIVGFDAWLVGCLVKSNRRAYLHLRSGWHTDSTYVAWGCRNLLELRIFSRYVARSSDDRKRFIDDMTIDTCQSMNVVIKMVEQAESGSSSSDEDLVELSHSVKALSAASGCDGNKYLSPIELAKEMQLEQELNIYKLCSKLIHPTAQSILLVEKESQDERDALFLRGGRYLIDSMYDLVPFIETLQKQCEQP